MAKVSKWEQWSSMFMAFSLRERAIMAITLVVAGGFLLFNFFVEPWQAKAVAASNALLAAQAEIPRQEAMLATIRSAPVDPDAANRKRLAQVKEQYAAIGEWLKQFETTLVQPQAMPNLLEGVLARHPRLEMLSMKNFPATVITAASDSSGGKSSKGSGPSGEAVFQHMIEMRVAGSYNDLLNYILALERLPQHLMWSSASVSVEKYPRTILVLKVYTLSFDENWMQI